MKAVLFDMDGVVVDSELHWKRCETAFLREKVPAWDEKHHPELLGLSVEGVHDYLSTRHGLTMTWPAFRDAYRDIAEEIYETHSELVPGVAALLADLQRRRVPVGLVSSSPREWIDRVLSRFELGPLFSGVVSADELGGEGKPSPAIYLRGAEAVGVSASSCAAVEDSRNGVVSAKRAGMRCVGIRNGYNDEQDLSEADIVVPGFHELGYERLRSLFADKA